MLKEIFKFSDRDINFQILHKNKLVTKINHCIKYLKDHLPVNELDADNGFDFSKLKYDEGKNYHWFFLTNETVTILVRQYGSHFTIFTSMKSKRDYEPRKLNIFTLYTNSDKMSDELSDAHCDNPFKAFQEVLPNLVKNIEEDKVHGLWNNLCFIRPDYLEVRLAFVSEESVHSLDKLVFACDEIFQIFLEKFSENDMLAKIKTLEVGQPFGTHHTIASIRSERKENDYYHNVGIKTYRNADETKKENWHDVYSLTRYYYETLFFGDIENKINSFVYINHDKVFELTFTTDIMMMMQFTGSYIKCMYDLFIADGNDVEYKVFKSFLPKNFEDFLECSYRVNLTKL